MGKFICSEVESGLQGFDNLFDVSELQGGDVEGSDSLVDSSDIMLV